MPERISGHTRNSWESRRTSLPLHAAISEEVLDRTCSALGHRMCGFGWGELAWAVPAGWPTFDDDGQLDNPMPGFVIAGWDRIRYLLVEQFDSSDLSQVTVTAEDTDIAPPPGIALHERIAN